jgi:hypothetical protein
MKVGVLCLCILTISSLAFVEVDPVIFSENFEQAELGIYTEAQLKHDFKNPRWSSGVQEGRVKIVQDKNATIGKCLQVLYPGGTFGPDQGGAQWILNFDQSYEELYCSYRIKFEKYFVFVKGGKIPGLAGGKGNTGGHVPNGMDGWSARMMWKQQGKIIQYVYHPGQSGKFGDTYDWQNAAGDVLCFKPDQWYQVEHHIIMNKPGMNNGKIEAWLDGKKSLEINDIKFRDVNDFAIDKFQFSTFFGGSDYSWSATKDEYLYFDDFIVSTKPITH